MRNETQLSQDDDDEKEDEKESTPIHWSNIMFLPFHPTWKLIVLFVVLIKCTLGPLSSIYTIHCSETWDNYSVLSLIKNLYNYVCDPIYVVDTFLFIVHRQVTEKAERREFSPKSAFLLILDLLALVPFFHLLNNETCPTVQLWPNILAFNEVLIIYRVVNYFSLVTTHSFWKLLFGYTINLLLYVNFLTCFLMLLTVEGLCENCDEGIFDWRSYLMTKINASGDTFTVHLYCSALILSVTVHKLVDETKPSTYLEFIICSFLMMLGYAILLCVILPKLFAEGVLHIRRICTFHPRVKRIIEETKRRNPSPSAHRSVERFYSLIWTKRNGITSIPEVIKELPRYLKLSINQDLYWPVFHHSPTFRYTSPSFKRWLCARISMDYKLPGEKFFAGQHCYSKLYYIKSGIVQFISFEDSVAATLSVTSGTILGDISFLLPALHRKVSVKCLTYCEVFSVTRANIVKALHKFPEDRRNIINLAQERIKHAHTMYNCKNNVRGIDRADDEGLSWIKKRWWEINSSVKTWKKSTKDHKKYLLAPEEGNYHCIKYIGQLVLGTNVQLQKKSIFVKVEFPWILAPYSVFSDIWNRIVIITVYLVMFLIPPLLASKHKNTATSEFFTHLKLFADFIYIADIIVSLMTAVERHGSLETSLVGIMFQRFKSIYFILDLLATAWIEHFFVIAGAPEFYYISQFNRLIKTYMLFFNRYKRIWSRNSDPIKSVMYRIGLTQFWFGYVIGYFLYMIVQLTPKLTETYFYGHLCFGVERNSTNSCHTEDAVLSVLMGWLFEILFPEHQPTTIFDVEMAMVIATIFFLMHLYTKSRFISTLYLKHREMINYYFFVSNLKTHYISHRIHPNLLKRLNKYLVCNWKYYNGMDVLHPNLLSEVPYDIYSKLHGDLAEHIVGNSQAFKNADPGLIRELANNTKFLILPNKSTLLAFGLHTKNVIWIAHGLIQCEYYNADGDLETSIISRGSMMSLSTVFLRKASLRTYTAITDVEVLYIGINKFFNIIERYSNEWDYFKTCEEEVIPVFDSAYQAYVKKHREHQKKLREMIYQTGNTTSRGTHSRLKVILDVFKEYRTNPESLFIRYWMGLRIIFVMTSIVSMSLQGGSGATVRPFLRIVGEVCDVVTCIDMVLKIFLPYYDERGLIITNIRMCCVHYFARGWFLDFIGSLQWDRIFDEVFEGLRHNEVLLLRTFFEFSHIYLITGFFDYIADIPTVNISLYMIIKWQLVVMLLMIGVSHFFLSMCIDLTWDQSYRLVSMERRNACWVPSYVQLDKYPTVSQLHHVYAESLTIAQCGLLIINLGKFHVEEETVQMTLVFLALGLTFWYLMGYCQTLLILYYRGNTLFQHGVTQLKKFLTAERVTKDVIDRAVNHFIYVWIRTKGVKVQILMNKRIGAVFRQDLGYFFYKKTFHAADTLLGGGEPLERLLAGNTFQMHFLPNEVIIREMELSSLIYIIHRGKVEISKNGEKLAVLSKGCMFGQFEGTTVRPVKVTATCIDHVDVLNLTIQQFQDIINNDIRETVADNPQSKNDFMALKKICPENPYNTTEYILRERLIIKLPWMSKPVSPESSNWYTYWLICIWMIGPVVSSVVDLLRDVLPASSINNVLMILGCFDAVHLSHIISEFYTMEVAVVDNKCVKKYKRLKDLIRCWFCIDVLTVVLPLLSLFVPQLWDLQMIRILRIHLVLRFERHFCRNFQTRAAPEIVKFVLILLLLHTFTCGWILIACRNKTENEFPVRMPQLQDDVHSLLDREQWIHPSLRKDGCPRTTTLIQGKTNKTIGFVVPKDWRADYLVAFTYIIITQTHTNMDSVVPLSILQIYYKVFVTINLYLVEMWLTSICISAVYTKFREVYYYDFHVSNLIIYLKQNGISQAFLQTVSKYTKLLWQRQRGNWLPEITEIAPTCLKEDILAALYMHHLTSLPIFKTLPKYFLMQLVARLRRVVIFPGNIIVQEGDIFPCIYFIHEGEVEKWYTDLGGENKMTSVLNINGYFGLIPGLFPDTPYKFSYYSRTVVDLVYLHFDDWQDLLNSYPDLKRELYDAAEKMKNK